MLRASPYKLEILDTARHAETHSYNKHGNRDAAEMSVKNHHTITQPTATISCLGKL